MGNVQCRITSPISLLGLRLMGPVVADVRRKEIMKTLFTALILSITLTMPARSEQLVAGPACELEPVESALTYHTPSYHPSIRKVLFSRVTGPVKFQFLSLPSFSPEYLLSVGEDSDGHFFGQALYPENQIWDFAGDVTNITVHTKTKRMPENLAKRANHVWESMLIRTRYQGRHVILDGIGYVFLCEIKIKNGYQPTLTGESYNPEKGTRPRLLADIGVYLFRYVNCTKAEEPNLEREISDLLSQLETSLKETNESNKATQVIGATAPQPGR